MSVLAGPPTEAPDQGFAGIAIARRTVLELLQQSRLRLVVKLFVTFASWFLYRPTLLSSRADGREPSRPVQRMGWPLSLLLNRPLIVIFIWGVS